MSRASGALRASLGQVSSLVGVRIPVVGIEPGRSGSRHWSACYAPHASMYFDQHGKVRACCQNTNVYLGDVRTDSLTDIWASAGAEQIRSSLERNDYSAGCHFCGWEREHLDEQVVFSRGFDHLKPSERRPAWPRHMEFSLSNTCNLQCTMCEGDLSSAIRRHRERRPPLPTVYTDAFFDQLDDFLPHLDEAKFLGGEPLLGREPLRVLEQIMALDAPPEVTITTNGTVMSPRVERIVEALRPRLNVSLDGATAATYEAIRVGASHAAVLANIERFCTQVGTDRVSIATCLMRSTWHEFAAVLTFAEERGLYAAVNVVRWPESMSLYTLPAEELAPIVARMEATDVSLTRSRQAAWTSHLAGLRHHLQQLQHSVGS